MAQGRLIIDVVEGLSVADQDECWWHVDVVPDLVMASTEIQGEVNKGSKSVGPVVSWMVFDGRNQA